MISPSIFELEGDRKERKKQGRCSHVAMIWALATEGNGDAARYVAPPCLVDGGHNCVASNLPWPVARLTCNHHLETQTKELPGTLRQVVTVKNNNLEQTLFTMCA